MNTKIFSSFLFGSAGCRLPLLTLPGWRWHTVQVNTKSHNCCRMHTKYVVEVNIKVISLALHFSAKKQDYVNWNGLCGVAERSSQRSHFFLTFLCLSLSSLSPVPVSSPFAKTHKSLLISFYQIESFPPKKKLNGKTPSENLLL